MEFRSPAPAVLEIAPHHARSGPIHARIASCCRPFAVDERFLLRDEMRTDSQQFLLINPSPTNLDSHLQ
ncbi:hypothetical protein TIFTF001_035610 [Ficus carica]|uniref:Uncharacterized protein n=1 Tax=Ficus carica TaxID=3494 RepID=A0AA88J6P1_FICCA|nr:hypothetical protein TIFTF001_035610 [Ficus carica]